MAKTKMDYKKMKLDTMLDWLESQKKPKKEIAEFANVALVVNEEGKEVKKTREAKAYFYNKYAGEIDFINAPKPKVEKVDIVDRLKAYK